MLAQRVQSNLRKSLRHHLPRVESDPAYLSAKLRELALRTYHAVRMKSDPGPADGQQSVLHSLSRHDWADLHSQIVQLERALDARRLESLASYVAALRQKIENCLI
jgi:hypothetical protein